MVPDVSPDDGMQPEPQLSPPHVRLAVPGTGVVEVVLGVGVVEVVLGVGVVEVVRVVGTGVVEVVRVVGTGVVEVGLQWGQEYMTFLHVGSSVRSIVQPDRYPPTAPDDRYQLSRNAQDDSAMSPYDKVISFDDANPTDASTRL
jgi:hypothetical protein